MSKTWTATDISNPVRLGRSGYSAEIEFQDNFENFHHFYLVATETRIAFGGACNTGFLESGYIEREEGESLDDTLQELISDLETYYNDGPRYVSRIVVNERM